jgi:hypothetical protein
MVLVDNSQSAKSGAIAPSKKALLTIGTRDNALSRAAVINKWDGVNIKTS